MRQRFINLVVLVCCLGFFSAANENGKSCTARTCCNMKAVDLMQRTVQMEDASPKGYDLSPLNTFVLSI